MTEEPDYFNEDTENIPPTANNLNKAVAILFVGGIYFVIFLKILFIK